MFPIKYIDNNLVWNKDNEVFAYYELIPYNYSFLSAEQKFIMEKLVSLYRERHKHSMTLPNISHSRRQRLGTWCFSILPITLVRM